MKPSMGWMKLKSDGSALGNLGGRGGDLIRNHDGNWVQRYARGLDHTSNFMAELWALKDGLILAREMGLNNLIRAPTTGVANVSNAKYLAHQTPKTPLYQMC